MRTQPTLTLADMKEVTGISIAAIQKLLDQLIQKKYVERGEKDGSWRTTGLQNEAKLELFSCPRKIFLLPKRIFSLAQGNFFCWAREFSLMRISKKFDAHLGKF